MFKFSFIIKLLIVLLFFLQLIIWLKLDYSPVTWDPAHHLTNNLQYFHLLSHPGLNSFKELLHVSIYPPFVGLSLLPLYFLFGESADKAVLFQNIIYIPILLIATCLIAKRINRKESGTLLVLLLLSYPQIFENSSKYFLDIPLTAMVSLSIYCLMRTEYFTSRKNSIIMGFILCVGMLTKIQFVIFLLGPALMVICCAIKDGYHTDTLIIRGKNIIISLFAAILISSVWYLPNLKNLAKHSVYAAVQEGIFRGQSVPYSFESLQYYIFSLINEQISFVYIVLFLIALVFYLKKITREKILVILWIIIPYIILTFVISLKQSRYIAPCLPSFAVITSVGLRGLSERYYKLFMVSVAVVSLLEVLSINFGINFCSKDIKVPFIPNQDIVLFKNGNSYNIPKTENWKIETCLSAIHEDMKKDDEFDRKVLRKPRLAPHNHTGSSSPQIAGSSIGGEHHLMTLIFSNHIVYNHLTLNYYSMSNNLNLKIKKSQWMNKDYLNDLIKNNSYRYFIFKTWPNISHPSEKEIYVNAIRFVYSYPKSFIRIYSMRNPDNSYTFVYKKNQTFDSYQEKENVYKQLQSSIRINNISIDSSDIKINFEGGVSPFGIEFYLLEQTAKSYFRGAGDERLYSWHMNSREKDIIKGQGGIAIKVLDVLGNESKYHICKTVE